MPILSATLPGLVRVGPVLDVYLTVPRIVEQQMSSRRIGAPVPIPMRALVDTGAGISIIRESVVRKLKQEPLGVEIIATGGIPFGAPTFSVRVLGPKGFEYEGVMAAAPLEGHSCDCLIGRDVLSRALLVYDGPAERFSLCL